MNRDNIERPQKDGKTARQRATENFYKKNRTLSVDLSIDFFDTVENYCKKKQITKREFIERAAAEYIDNH